MKKIIVFIIAVVLLVFILPILFTQKFNKFEQVVSENIEETNDTQNGKNNYKYTNYATIKLLHKNNGEIVEMPIDEYLLGVVSAEMPADFEEEALKAQAVVARTYTIYMIKNSNAKHENADICDDSTCCQAWISKEDRMNKWDEDKREDNWEKIEKAVYETQGKIITYENEPIEAFFHANSGGKTEEVSNVWGGRRLAIFTKC